MCLGIEMVMCCRPHFPISYRGFLRILFLIPKYVHGELKECDMCLNPVPEILNICIGRLRLVTIRLSLDTILTCAGCGRLVRFGLKRIVLMIGSILFVIALSGLLVVFLLSRLDVHCAE